MLNISLSNIDLVKIAISEKKVIAMYKGHYRELCPHVVGLKNGKLHGLFYQFGGSSSSKSIIPGSKANWRCINRS